MVVQHNLSAMNTNRMLGITTSAQAKSTEKLSSGYRINRAADDAAGLSISEKMRKQIRGLTQASSNAQDGISCVQTAEGALTEVHSMLQRMNELATQASNGTNSQVDRDAIQAEVDQLGTEIDRVSETTKFNEIYLLKGNKTGETSSVEVNAHDAGLTGKLTDNGDGSATFELGKALEDGDKVSIAGKDYTIGSKTSSTDGYDTATNLGAVKLKVGDSVTSGTTTKTLVDKIANADAAYAADDTITIGDKTYTIQGTTDLSADQLKATDAKIMVDEALAKGETVKITSKKIATGLYAAGAKTDIEVVSSLKADEVSSLDGTTLGANKDFTALKGTAVGAGDTVVSGGKSFTATANTPATMDNVKDVVKALQTGDVITIGTQDITIGAETKFGANPIMTTDDVLALLNDNDAVAFKTVNSESGKSALAVAGLKAATDYTAVETKVASSDENVLSKTDAYKLMAEELTKASSIGTDKAATVTSDNSGTFTINKGTVNVKDALSFSLHVGADADMTNKITVDLDSMSTAGLGIKGINVSDDNGTAATYAIDSIADAISKVSSQRSALGAVQNRLEHTIANLNNISENTTSAESAIRDVDMATEMVEYSKNNILAQAGQSMLAQANQSTQGVLSLLQ